VLLSWLSAVMPSIVSPRDASKESYSAMLLTCFSAVAAPSIKQNAPKCAYHPRDVRGLGEKLRTL